MGVESQELSSHHLPHVSPPSIVGWWQGWCWFCLGQEISPRFQRFTFWYRVLLLLLSLRSSGESHTPAWTRISSADFPNTVLHCFAPRWSTVCHSSNPYGGSRMLGRTMRALVRTLLFAQSLCARSCQRCCHHHHYYYHFQYHILHHNHHCRVARVFGNVGVHCHAVQGAGSDGAGRVDSARFAAARFEDQSKVVSSLSFSVDSISRDRSSPISCAHAPPSFCLPPFSFMDERRLRTYHIYKD